MLSPDPDAPYDRPPLSKDFLRGESDEASLPLAEPGEFERLGIERRVGSVVSLDAGRRVARTSDGTEIPYRTCILATGSAPWVLRARAPITAPASPPRPAPGAHAASRSSAATAIGRVTSP